LFWVLKNMAVPSFAKMTNPFNVFKLTPSYTRAIIVLLIALSAILIGFSCYTLPEYEYKAPEKVNNDWQTATIDEVGLDTQILSKLIARIHADKYKNIHSILIVKNGKLVLEEYFGGHRFLYSADQCKGEFIEFGKDTLHNTQSVTKIITSTIIGIAIDKGFIKNVDEEVFSFFPKYSHLNNEKKAKITIEHLLTMTSGLEWNEMDVDLKDPSKNDVVRLFEVDDPIEYILAKPIVAEPGTRWYYSGGDVILLGEIIKSAIGMNITEFAIGHFFKPLGITDVVWIKLTSEVISTQGGIYMRPRDMAKIGQLYLQKGVWNGNRIVSENWITESTLESIQVPPSKNPIPGFIKS